MDIEKRPLHADILNKAERSGDFKLYKAALEWELIEPIVIEDREDLRSEHKWRDRIEPYHHQVTNLISFCRRLPVSLLADDVGLGKTISAGLVMSELISRGRISKILIICPKILREQWQEELKFKFDISSEIVTGRELISASKKLFDDVGAIITTYNTARLYLDSVKRDSYDMLILDEAHKLRNLYGTEKSPQVALTFHKALSERMFKYVLMLTATPIQNRLWDLYSLVELLTVARGHQNPFGNEGMFARRFIADGKTNARRLRPEAQDEFRSIVYSYMSRVRREDAKLHFPERKVQLHQVEPSEKELELLEVIAEPIQELNFLAQIVILQALISSPEALVKVLEGMSQKGTAPRKMFEDVKEIAKHITLTTKLNGLQTLIKGLREEKPDTWRVVVFTRWRETQTSIQAFLEEQGIACGLINGDSSVKNQETISKFKKDIPEINVVVSTEAGSEGVNMQAANVLVNYDLPWNPMVVEQRIGRIQRLASEHANVSIFNIVLKGTFEEYIVGRLMEKLQLASSAIGDIEALLEASGIEDSDDNASSFEERIRRLVIDSLAGKNVEVATRKAEESIENAKVTLKREEKNINALLGGVGGENSTGPKCPKLPHTKHSMSAEEFVIAALSSKGAIIEKERNGVYKVQLGRKSELIRFNNEQLSSVGTSVLYAPGTPGFDRLVRSYANRALHEVNDLDRDTEKLVNQCASGWTNQIGAKLQHLSIKEVKRHFSGKALVRVRATVTHDSYERLVEVNCRPDEHRVSYNKSGLENIGEVIEGPSVVGIAADTLANKASGDRSVMDFCRFYTERRTIEVASAGDDLRKKKKLEDEFTPRLELSLVGIQGEVYREVIADVEYSIENSSYESELSITPVGEKVEGPTVDKCAKTGMNVPVSCLEKCEISGLVVLRHLLIKSDISDRYALPEYTTVCTLTHKRVLEDEVEASSVTGNPVIKDLLKVSVISGKKAEPDNFAKCEFTQAEALKSELAVSQVSGKKYRFDEEQKSVVSGKKGHRQEFITCAETGNPILQSEAKTCEVTGKVVMPGILETCEVTGKRVLPNQLTKSSVSGKKALRKLFVESSLSKALLLEDEAIKSISGRYCVPSEARICQWSGRMTHPEDLKTCELTGLTINSQYLRSHPPVCLETLFNLLNATDRSSDKENLWPSIQDCATRILGGGTSTIESSAISDDEKHIAVAMDVKTWVGLKKRRVGYVYSLEDKNVIGRITTGKQTKSGWVQEH